MRILAEDLAITAIFMEVRGGKRLVAADTFLQGHAERSEQCEIHCRLLL